MSRRPPKPLFLCLVKMFPIKAVHAHEHFANGTTGDSTIAARAALKPVHVKLRGHADAPLIIRFESSTRRMFVIFLGFGGGCWFGGVFEAHRDCLRWLWAGRAAVHDFCGAMQVFLKLMCPMAKARQVAAQAAAFKAADAGKKMGGRLLETYRYWGWGRLKKVVERVGISENILGLG